MLFYSKSLPLEWKVDFSALPKKADEVFLHKPPYSERKDNIRPHIDFTEPSKYSRHRIRIPGLLRRQHPLTSGLFSTKTPFYLDKPNILL